MRPIETLVRPIFGRPCWAVEYEPQLNLKLSFGRPSLHVLREPGQLVPPARQRRWSGRRIVVIRAEYWLWVYAGRWKVSLASGRSATASSPVRLRAEVFKHLQGQKPTSITLDPRTAATQIAFDLGGVLEIRRPSLTESDDLWLLYKPRGMVLAVRGDGTYAYGRGDRARDEYEQRPLRSARGAA